MEATAATEPTTPRTPATPRSWWSRVRHAKFTTTKIGRRRVHKDNYFGAELRGTSTEEEKVGAAIELGVGWLIRAEATEAQRRIGFVDGYGVKCHI